MAGLGKYCMGGYGQIGVYRVNFMIHDASKKLKISLFFLARWPQHFHFVSL